MANIRVDTDFTIEDGAEVVFRSPVDCSAVTGLIVYYPTVSGTTTSKTFQLSDAHGNNVGNIDNLFTEDVVVKVILDVTAGIAYVQNADTNAYLEGKFTILDAVVDKASVLESMIVNNDFVAPIGTDDSDQFVITDDDGNAILADWKYKTEEEEKENVDLSYHLKDKRNPHGITLEQIGAAPAGYPNAIMTEKFGNYGGADAGKFDYLAHVYVTEYSNGIVDVAIRGKFTVESASTFDYGIDTTAVLSAINQFTGKNYTTWETQRALQMDIIDAVTGSHLVGLAGYQFCVVRRTNASKLYLAISRVHTVAGAAGPWNLEQVYNATSNGSAYMNLCLRAKLS